MSDYLKRGVQKLLSSQAKLLDMHSMQVDDYIERHLFQNAKYASPKKLNRFEYQVFSQFGEDGIIQEIFSRIGTTNKFFVEFGVESGVECNSTYLLHMKDWSGLWIEADSKFCEQIKESFKTQVEGNKLKVLQSFVTAENIEDLFAQGGVPKEPDLLSIDIDSNDYYIWKNITNYRPRVVIMEYNGVYRPGDTFTVKYDPNGSWDGSSHFGASLQILHDLGVEKGYRLVGCNFAGINAFFVREDLLGDLFEAPFTTENHYEKPRYFLYKKDGHMRRIK